jgi:hypothetical protein
VVIAVGRGNALAFEAEGGTSQKGGHGNHGYPTKYTQFHNGTSIFSSLRRIDPEHAKTISGELHVVPLFRILIRTELIFEMFYH